MPIAKKENRVKSLFCKPCIPVDQTYFAILLFLLISLALPAWAQEKGASPGKDLRILRITPTGIEVPPGRQLVIQFDRPVVPLGRMERDAGELPITIEPQLNCQWRWLDPANLACNLGEKDALQPATEYRLVVGPGITDEGGATLGETVRHTFTTIRPRITEAWFKTWLGPRLPQNSVRGNLPVDLGSLTDHLLYLADGRRIPAKVQKSLLVGSYSGTKVSFLTILILRVHK
jgi:hypothetical protein